MDACRCATRRRWTPAGSKNGRSNSVCSCRRAPFCRRRAGASIPTTAYGITRTLAVTEVGQIAAIEVAVDITHTYIGDLRVTLHSPGGTAWWCCTTAAAAVLTTCARSLFRADVAVLQALAGDPCAGKWKLQVQDLAARDVGKLNRWSLDITLQAAAPPRRGQRRRLPARPRRRPGHPPLAPRRPSRSAPSEGQ